MKVDVAAPPTSIRATQHQPDLVPLGVLLASGVLDGSPSRSFTFRSFIRNDGDSESATTTLRFYRSRNPTIAPSDTLVGSVAALAASGGTCSGLLLSLTAPSTAGTYYYGGCAVTVPREPDTTNNCSSSSARLDVN